MTDALTEQIRSIPLPSGWIEQFDNDANHPFWVDTNAKPARSIWTHPYEDEERLMQQQTHGDRQGQHRDSTKKKGFMEKIKDKAIGTKEEREQQRRISEAHRQQRMQQLQALQQQRMQALQHQRQMYGHQGMGMYGRPYGAPPMMMGGGPMMMGGRRRGMGGGGMGMPLMGGLAGGMLLGAGMNEMMDGGDCGGGDMGGDMGGGDF
ncbi:hypothetical protein BDV98DRAFT_434283 [Pterulicium gracile]|uniref:WW domain-containing protein n=1 Tax=Pterulicium gracile TaxID=1884261 RepID=A0A5C3QW85_9AGAR|nr:hypothetical protein BDV98DRAFT_434283 [Pterula gracilis]